MPTAYLEKLKNMTQMQWMATWSHVEQKNKQKEKEREKKKKMEYIIPL